MLKIQLQIIGFVCFVDGNEHLGRYALWEVLDHLLWVPANEMMSYG